VRDSGGIQNNCDEVLTQDANECAHRCRTDIKDFRDKKELCGQIVMNDLVGWRSQMSDLFWGTNRVMAQR